MTKKEYLENLATELFGEDLFSKKIVDNPKYIEFETDVEEIIKKDFAKIGCDTSDGEPTWLGLSLWMDSNVNEEMKEMLEGKYKNKH